MALVLAPALRSSAQAQPIRAGVAAAVRGQVRLAEQTGGVGRDVASGTPVYLGNEISTGPNAGLQIMLLDETVFTIGPDSKLKIDEFVYDPRSDDGKVSATISKGVFRFVSGRIAHKQPDNMKVELPSGTIGIRGTSAMGSTDGTSSSVVLLGPGATNNAGERPGRIEVSNAAGRVELRAPLFGTTVGGPGSAPTPAARWTPEHLEALTSTLAAAGPPPEKGGEKGGGEARSEGSGSGDKQDKAGAEPKQDKQGNGEKSGPQDAAPGGPGKPGEGGDGLGKAGPAPLGPIALGGPSSSELAGQRDVETIGTLGFVPVQLPPGLPPPNDLPANPGVPMLSELTSFDQLRSLQSGLAGYMVTSVPLAGPGNGQYNLSFTIDLAAQNIHLDRFDGFYAFTGEQPLPFSNTATGTDVFNYASATGLVNNFSDIEDDGTMQQPNGDTVRLLVEVVNAGTTIAGKARTRAVVHSAQSGAELTGAAEATRAIVNTAVTGGTAVPGGNGLPGGPAIPGTGAP